MTAGLRRIYTEYRRGCFDAGRLAGFDVPVEVGRLDLLMDRNLTDRNLMNLDLILKDRMLNLTPRRMPKNRIPRRVLEEPRGSELDVHDVSES